MLRFNDNDLVLGRSYIYSKAEIIFGGRNYDRWFHEENTIQEVIDKAMKSCDTIRFFVTGVIINKSLFSRRFNPEYERDPYTLYELQTVLLKQELFEKTVFYDIDEYEEHLNDVPYDNFIEYCQKHIHIVDVKDILVNA